MSETKDSWVLESGAPHRPGTGQAEKHVDGGKSDIVIDVTPNIIFLSATAKSEHNASITSLRIPTDVMIEAMKLAGFEVTAKKT